MTSQSSEPSTTPKVLAGPAGAYASDVVATPYRGAPAFACPPRKQRRPSLASKRELIGLGGFALLYHVAFGLDGVGGFGGAVFFMVAAVLVVVARPRVRSRWLVGGIFAAVVAMSVRLSYAPSTAIWFFAWTSLGALSLAMWQRRVHVTEIALANTVGLGFAFTQVGGFTRRIAGRLRAERLFPVLAALGVASLVGLVFAPANPVVARFAKDALYAIAKLWSPSLFMRFVATCVVGMFGVTLMRPFVSRKKVETIAIDTVPATDTFRMVATATLVVVNVLFFAYNVLDAIVLIGGRPPADVTTQAYAHQGAAWLTVALGLTTATLSLCFRDKLTIDERARNIRRMAFGWIAQSMILALFAAERVRMHIEFSGLSDLRFVAMFGIATATMGLAIVAYKIHARRSFMWLFLRQLDAFVIATAIYTLIPTYVISARVNVARIQNGDLGPLVHVEEQARSSEAAPLFLPLLDHENEGVRAGVGAVLNDKLDMLQNRPRRWSEGNITDRRAYEALKAQGKRLLVYGGNPASFQKFVNVRNERAWEAANARY